MSESNESHRIASIIVNHILGNNDHLYDLRDENRKTDDIEDALEITTDVGVSNSDKVINHPLIKDKISGRTVTRIKSKLRSTSREVLLGVYSDDSRYHNILRGVHSDLRNHFDTSTTNEYFYKEVPASGSFDNVLTLAGSPQVPMGHPLICNMFYREKELGLTTQIFKTKRHAILYLELLMILIKRSKFTPIKIGADSYTGFPDGDSDNEHRTSIIKFTLDNAETLLTHFYDSGSLGLLKDYSYSFLSLAGRRDMLTTKVRKYNPIEYSLSMGLQGSPLDMNGQAKTSGGIPVSGLHGERPRFVWATSVGVNILNALIAQRLESGFPEKTFVTRGREHLQDEINKYLRVRPGVYSIRGIDTSAFDNSCDLRRSMWAFDVLMKCGILDKRLHAWWEASLFAPAVYPDGGDNLGAVLQGSVKQDASRYKYRIPMPLKSGHRGVSLIGKLEMTWCTICALDSLYLSEGRTENGLIGLVEKYLDWELDDAQKDGGDDQLLIMRGDGRYDELMRIMTEQGYYSTAIENPCRYLGMLIKESHGLVEVHSDLQSCCANSLWAEKNVYSPLRKFPGLGSYVKRYMAYSDNVGTSDAFKIIDRHFERNYGYNHAAIVGAMLKKEGSSHMLGGLSGDDIMVLAKPNTIHYLNITPSATFNTMSKIYIDQDQAEYISDRLVKVNQNTISSFSNYIRKLFEDLSNE